MSTHEFLVQVQPPRFDAHYCTVVCRATVDGERSIHETGVPTKDALAQTVATQRQRAAEAASETSHSLAITVEIGAGFSEELSRREVLGDSTLARSCGAEPDFDWAQSQPEYDQYLRVLQTQRGQRALDLSVTVDGDQKRAFVGARSTGEFVATGDTDWLADVDSDLQTCRLVAALGEYRAQYDLESARVGDLAGTPLATCQPFQRRSVMWASPPSP